jgi:hypothetical protein
MKLYVKCFNTNHTWQTCWLDHCHCNGMLSLKFPVTMATRGRLKIAKITILSRPFPSKFISKWCNFSRDKDRVKCFLALVTRYLMVDLGSFLASHKSKTFLAMRRDYRPPSNPPNRKENNPLLATPWCIFGWRGRRKSAHFFNNISKTKTCFKGRIGHVFHYLRP